MKSPDMVRSLVLSGYGLNCEEETAAAYRMAGAMADVLHLGELMRAEKPFERYDIITLPGGFSFGDDIASGRVLANRIALARLPGGGSLLDSLRGFAASGGFLLGVCNGFQVLVKLGLLPDLGGEGRQELTLAANKSGRFEDRWCRCRVSGRIETPFLRGLDVLSLPVRHGEGRLLPLDAGIAHELIAAGSNVLTYCDTDGHPARDYPDNPNGSMQAIAGLADRTGQIFGLMPHPEAYLSLYNHPDWPRLKRENRGLGEEGAGLAIFTNIVSHIKEKRK